jgi:hypothetical protein
MINYLGWGGVRARGLGLRSWGGVRARGLGLRSRASRAHLVASLRAPLVGSLRAPLVASLRAPLVGSLDVEVLIIRFHFNIFRRRVDIFSIGIHFVVPGQVGVVKLLLLIVRLCLVLVVLGVIESELVLEVGIGSKVEATELRRSGSGARESGEQHGGCRRDKAMEFHDGDTG